MNESGKLLGKFGPQEGHLQYFRRASCRIFLIYAEHINPFPQLSEPHCHNGLTDGSRPFSQGKICGIHHFQQCIGQSRISADDFFQLIHVRLILGYGSDQLEEISLQIIYFVRFCHQCFRNVVAFHIFHVKSGSQFVFLFCVHSCGNTFFAEGLGHFHYIVQGSPFFLILTAHRYPDIIGVFQHTEVLG